MREILEGVIQRMQTRTLGTHIFAQAQLATGLRSAEVIERGRWHVDINGLYSVQLAKKGDIREFRPEALPQEFRQYLADQRLAYPWTYSSYLHDLQKTGVSFKFTGVKKDTYSHAFRYYEFRRLQQLGLGVEEIQSAMHHTAVGSTLYYLLQPGFYQDLHGVL